MGGSNKLGLESRSEETPINLTAAAKDLARRRQKKKDIVAAMRAKIAEKGL